MSNGRGCLNRHACFGRTSSLLKHQLEEIPGAPTFATAERASPASPAIGTKVSATPSRTPVRYNHRRGTVIRSVEVRVACLANHKLPAFAHDTESPTARRFQRSPL